MSCIKKSTWLIVMVLILAISAWPARATDTSRDTLGICLIAVLGYEPLGGALWCFTAEYTYAISRAIEIDVVAGLAFSRASYWVSPDVVMLPPFPGGIALAGVNYLFGHRAVHPFIGAAGGILVPRFGVNYSEGTERGWLILGIGKAGLRLDARRRSLILSIGWCISTEDTLQWSSAGETIRVQGLLLAMDLASRI
jgi:hypothetical protein